MLLHRTDQEPAWHMFLYLSKLKIKVRVLKIKVETITRKPDSY